MDERYRVMVWFAVTVEFGGDVIANGHLMHPQRPSDGHCCLVRSGAVCPNLLDGISSNVHMLDRIHETVSVRQFSNHRSG